jgi:hypothetical protein
MFELISQLINFYISACLDDCNIIFKKYVLFMKIIFYLINIF